MKLMSPLRKWASSLVPATAHGSSVFSDYYEEAEAETVNTAYVGKQFIGHYSWLV